MTPFPPPGDISGLVEPDPGRLHVFIAGPGTGEGVAVVLPGGEWILVDGCRVPAGGDGHRGLPLLALWRGLGRGRVRWMVLTHPHVDHAAGFARVADEVHPEHVGLFPRGGAESSETPRPPPASGHPLRRNEVRVALQAIRRHGGRALSAGTILWRSDDGREGGAATAGSARVVAVSPEPSAIPTHREPEPNELSTAIAVRFGETRVLLGADLPTSRPGGGARVPTGWDRVVADHGPEVCEATGVKVPHHGSREAWHPDIGPGPGPGCLAWVTPFAASGLPRPDGLRPWIAARGATHLTANPLPAARQPSRPPAPATIDLPDYAAWHRQGRRVGAPPWSGSTLGPVWGAAFDDRGNLVGHWRGEATVVITGPGAPNRSSP